MLSYDNEESYSDSDHRKIIKDMKLARFEENAPGQVFWLPKGWFMFRAVESFIRDMISRDGYEEVNSPQMMSQGLWERSGHWEKYSENMILASHDESRSGDVYAMKPMSCPAHVLMFKSESRSWKDLPLRISEFGRCVRYEPSGSLQGMMRLRAFTQDDGHIFCSESQVEDESVRFIKLVLDIYEKLGFSDVEVRFSDRPKKRIGSDEIWDKAEHALIAAAEKAGVSVVHSHGEGAFYGPKLEFSLKDSKGRVWQCGTLQVDFVLAERFGANFVNSDNEREAPVILHRAVLGSLERFIAIMLENNGGRMPAWMMKEQVVIMPVSERHQAFCEDLDKDLRKSGIRSVIDGRPEKIGRKVRDSLIRRDPVFIVIGDKEVESGVLSVRAGGGEAEQIIRSEAPSILKYVMDKI